VAPKFHKLTIAEVRRETPDAISVRFEVPDHLVADYAFTQGQHLTLKASPDGEEVRRSYSICAGVDDGALRVAIKRVPGGLFSTWAAEKLHRGQTLDVLTPDGRFNTPLDPANQKHYAAFAAGSGITPVLSLIRTTLAREPLSQFTLVYGNRRQTDTLFQEELEDLKDQYLTRFTLYNLFSRERQDIDLFNGRLDATKISAFADSLLPLNSVDEAFVCGPGGMIDDVERALMDCGLPPQHIHIERFGIPDESRAPPRSKPGDAPQARVTIVLDGVRREFDFYRDDPSLLDAAIAAGIDVPYSCKGGMCCTCRSKATEGAVRMDKNYSLEKTDVDAGFVLTCQSHPLTETLTLNFDER
jgi:ring-1,2-phenylacetyl-CoA epoxidase subunit PaaE